MDAARPPTDSPHFSGIYERILDVAAEQLGGEARFVGCKEWIIRLYQERFPNEYPASVDRRLISNFIQQAAYRGVVERMIRPEKPKGSLMQEDL